MSRVSSWSAADVAARLSKSGKGRSKKSGDGWMAPCPAHDDRTPSLSLKNNAEGRLLWHCFGGCEAEDVKRALVAVLGGEEPPAKSEGSDTRAREKVKNPKEVVFPVPRDAGFSIEDFQHSTYGAPVRVWTYRLPDGEIGGWTARFDLGEGDKEVLPFTWFRNAETGAEGVHMKSMPVPRPLYNLDRILANPEAIVLIAEGEKSADAAEKLFPDWIATAIPGGCNAVRQADFSVLANRIVVIMADHDGPGYDFALKLIGIMPVSTELRFMVWPTKWAEEDGGAPYVMEKGFDADDHVAAGWSTEKLRRAVAESGGQLCHRIEYIPEGEFEPRQYVDNKPS